MLRTNSKKAVANIRNYIVNNFDGSNYGVVTPETFEETAKIIYEIFKIEEFQHPRESEQSLFINWCQGLPSILDTCYYYNRSAIEDVAIILEETETEANKYTEAQAEELISKLMYREIKKAL